MNVDELKLKKIKQAYYHIKERCYSTKCKGYKNYGGRGIIMCEKWLSNRSEFIIYVSSLPDYQEKYSLDRIENDGNYEEENLRWADKHTQSTNQRMPSTNTSGFIGVKQYIKKKSKQWRSYLRLLLKFIHIGYFETCEEAVEARKKYIIDNNLLEYL